MRIGAFRISLVYIVISILWITFSDRLLFLVGHRLSNGEFLWLSSGKGYFFVIVTGLLLFFLIRSDNRKLDISGAQYRDMYDSNPNPMWIYDPETLCFVSVNDAAVDVYGYTRGEFLSKSILDIRPVEDRADVVAAAARLEGNINQSGTWRHIKKDGREIIVNITSHQILFNGQTHILVMVRDVTEYVIFERKLERMNQDLLEEKRKLHDTQLFTKVAGWEFYPDQRRLV
ncbi:MAG TPA: PAS domain S-box protein, partial [Mucilaginibacter sp.]